MATYYSRLKVNIDAQRQNLYSQFFYIIRVYKDSSLTEILPVLPPPILTPFSQDWRTVDTKIENASEQTRIFYDIYHNGVRVHKDIRGRRLGLPYTQDPEKNTTTFSIKTTSASTTTSNSNIKQQKITTISKPNVLIFYIGGAGDKRAWKILVPTPMSIPTGKSYEEIEIGPNYNIVDVQENITKYINTILTKPLQIQKTNNRFNDINTTEQHITKILGKNRYQSSYLGYYEVCKASQRQQIITNTITNKYSESERKNLKIIVIGHSLGGWNSVHFARSLSDSGYPVEYLISIDPVGEGAGVQIISDVISKYPPDPKVKTSWINIREIGTEGADWVARLGGRWVPGYYLSNPGALLQIHFKFKNPIFPNLSYVSKWCHDYTWEAMSDSSKLIKIDHDYNPDLENYNTKKYPAVAINGTPWNMIAFKIKQWLTP